MPPIISISQLYSDAKDGSTIPILSDIIPLLRSSPGISSRELSAQLGLNRNALSLSVKMLTGETLNDLLKHWRLLRAMDLLRDSSIPYLEVAHQCGYRTVDGLTKFMERNLRCTAREYREKRIHGNRQKR